MAAISKFGPIDKNFNMVRPWVNGLLEISSQSENKCDLYFI